MICKKLSASQGNGATEADPSKVGTPFVMQPDGMIGVLNSSDHVGSLEINGNKIDGVDGVEVGVLVNLVSGVVAEQQKQQGSAATGQAGVKVEVEVESQGK